MKNTNRNLQMPPWGTEPPWNRLYGELAIGLLFALMAPPMVLAAEYWQKMTQTGEARCPDRCRCSCNASSEGAKDER
jgi:hypothetical protein